jgi:phage terminase Nu1 subunit (DNA packaging protein)
MKRKMEMKNLKLKFSDGATPAELATWFGLTIEEIATHASGGVLIRAAKSPDLYRLKASVTAYCGHVRTAASGREGPTVNERLRILRARADLAELKAKFDAGEMLEVSLTEGEWSTTLRTVRSLMMALPSRIAAQVPHLDRRDISEIDLEVREVLTEAANDHSKPARAKEVTQ